MARWYKEAAGPYSGGQHPTLLPAWTYYVHVCSFRFRFNSLEHIPRYIEYYQTKILPSRRQDMKKWRGDHSEAQGWECLPLFLREEAKRQQVVKALTEALADFHKQETKRRRR